MKKLSQKNDFLHFQPFQIFAHIVPVDAGSRAPDGEANVLCAETLIALLGKDLHSSHEERMGVGAGRCSSSLQNDPGNHEIRPLII